MLPWAQVPPWYGGLWQGTWGQHAALVEEGECPDIHPCHDTRHCTLGRGLALAPPPIGIATMQNALDISYYLELTASCQNAGQDGPLWQFHYPCNQRLCCQYHIEQRQLCSAVHPMLHCTAMHLPTSPGRPALPTYLQKHHPLPAAVH